MSPARPPSPRSRPPSPRPAPPSRRPRPTVPPAASPAPPSELETRLRIAQESARIGVWDFDHQSGLITWTPQMETLYGVAPGTFSGRFEDFLAFLHPEDRKTLLEHTDRVVRAPSTFDLEFRIVRPDGEVRWIHSRGASLAGPGGKVRRMIGVNMDVTGRREMEQLLAESEERLRVAMAATGMVVFHQDRQLRYTWLANPSLGAEREAILGRTDEDLSTPESAAALTKIKRRVLRTGRPERNEVFVDNGSQSGWFELTAEPRRDAQGHIIGLLCTGIDISERKRAEADRAETHRRLQQLAAGRQDAIEAERAQISREVHDVLGSALTGVQLSLATLARTPALDAPAARARLTGLEKTVGALIEATRGICARLRPAVLDDVGLAEAARWYVRQWSELSGLEVRFAFPKQRLHLDPPLRIDLYRALQELLTNVSRHAGARHARVSLRATPAAILLRVADDGRGFDPARATRGLGLPGLRERLAWHGGTLDIVAGPGGTTVTARVPRRARS